MASLSRKTHVELPTVNEFFCRSIPYGYGTSISLDVFKAKLEAGYMSPKLYCQTCRRMATEYVEARDLIKGVRARKDKESGIP